jgi:hypothetical protein
MAGALARDRVQRVTDHGVEQLTKLRLSSSGPDGIDTDRRQIL